MSSKISTMLALPLVLTANPVAADGKDETESPYDSLTFRAIGPAFFSGRISDFAVLPGSDHAYYAATASGGLWLTTNNGTTWTPLFDQEDSYALGVVELDPKNPRTVWVGTGENNAQRSVGWGDGVYKSVNAGKNWTRVGLENSAHIGQIAIHPEETDTVFVAAQGPLWSSGGDRGLYKTTNGGESWKRVLFVDEDTGANEVIIHPQRPDHMIASTYQRRRHLWVLINGGPGSGLHKSTDGGETWRALSEGLPEVEMGRIGIAFAPSRPDTVYAIIEAAEVTGSAEARKKSGAGIYRSTDFGETWTKMSDHMTTSPQYYNELVVDPKNPATVYSLDTFTHVSRDEGRTWTKLGWDRKHVDDHALWIDPTNTAHLRMGSDGGIYESYDGGTTWGHVHNLPIAQFYRIAVDQRKPFYFVCGGTQDNNSTCGPSRTTDHEGIFNEDWTVLVGGDGYEPQIDPTDPNIVYAQYQYGGLARYDFTTGERVFIAPQPASGESQLRWNWNSPLLISPHDPKRLYYGAEKLFRSDDRGNSWQAVSPDLSRGIDRNTLEVMGRVWSVDAVAKNDSTSFWGSLIAISESPKQADLVYVGTDDGLIQVTEDGGVTWRTIESLPGVPDMSYVEDIEASRHDVDTVYAVVDNHKRGDFKPYVLKSTNRGRSWRSIGKRLPRGPAHALVEDTHDPKLLFVGTEWGLHFTQDGGRSWQALKGKLPTIDVRDLDIQRREDDLVVGTFGRGIYVLDSIAPLRVPKASLDEASVLFPVEDAWLYVERDRWSGKHSRGRNYWSADNPPFGAVFNYFLSDELKTHKAARRKLERERMEKGKGNPYPSWEKLRQEDREKAPTIVLTVRDGRGEVVRRVTGPTTKGFHRVAWDLRYPPSDPIDLEPPADRPPWYEPPVGPLALPGTYTVELAQRIDGKRVVLSKPKRFVVKPLDQGSPLVTKDRGALLAFQEKTAQLWRTVTGSSESLKELKRRLAHVEAAMNRTPAAEESLRGRATRLGAQVEDLAVVLMGDRTRSERNEPTPWSISQRLSSIIFGHWRSQADVTHTHKQAYAIAKKDLADAITHLKALHVQLVALEKELEQRGAPWTPSRVPAMPTDAAPER